MLQVKMNLKNLLSHEVSTNRLFKRNILKEFLQILVLDFIYSHPEYSQLVFYGGSALSHCFDLPRLSEDLDFVDIKKKIDILKMVKDLEAYFLKNTDLNLKTTSQKFRIYLKFPIMHDLKLVDKNESDLLFLKIEVFNGFNFCKNYRTEIIPLFKFNKSILIKTFDLSTLMATKIRAVLYRKWEKTNKTGGIIAYVKGRDYFDLMWYLEKKIKPNIKCLENVKDKNDLKEKLLKIVKKVDSKSIQSDLEPLIEDKNFVKNLSKNIKDILVREISQI